MSTQAKAPGPSVERAKQAIGRWSLLDAEARSPTESFAVVAEVVRHLPEDARAVRATFIAMAKELAQLRLRIDALERELAAFQFAEEDTPPPTQYARHPPTLPSDDDPLPMAEPEEVFADPGEVMRARLRELSNLIDLNFPTGGGPK